MLKIKVFVIRQRKLMEFSMLLKMENVFVYLITLYLLNQLNPSKKLSET